LRRRGFVSFSGKRKGRLQRNKVLPVRTVKKTVKPHGRPIDAMAVHNVKNRNIFPIDDRDFYAKIRRGNDTDKPYSVNNILNNGHF
jgi:hypothetical protein